MCSTSVEMYSRTPARKSYLWMPKLSYRARHQASSLLKSFLQNLRKRIWKRIRIFPAGSKVFFCTRKLSLASRWLLYCGCCCCCGVPSVYGQHLVHISLILMRPASSSSDVSIFAIAYFSAPRNSQHPVERKKPSRVESRSWAAVISEHSSIRFICLLTVLWLITGSTMAVSHSLFVVVAVCDTREKPLPIYKSSGAHNTKKLCNKNNLFSCGTCYSQQPSIHSLSLSLTPSICCCCPLVLAVIVSSRPDLTVPANGIQLVFSLLLCCRIIIVVVVVVVLVFMLVLFTHFNHSLFFSFPLISLVHFVNGLPFFWPEQLNVQMPIDIYFNSLYLPFNVTCKF